MAFIDSCPRGGADWLDYFDEYREHGQTKDKGRCLEKMKKFAREYEAKIKAIEKKEPR
jgi:hypothetical protein